MRKNLYNLEDQKTRTKGIATDVDPRGKQIAYVRLAILRVYRRQIPTKEKFKQQAENGFLKAYNLGLILPETFAKPKYISRSTLYNWRKAYKKDGLRGLIPRHRYKKNRTNLSFMNLIPIYKKIIIQGRPRAKGKNIFQSQLRRQWQGLPIDGPITISISFDMPIQKGTKMQKRMLMLKHWISHTRNPESTVLTGFVLGCMKGVVFREYRQIVRFQAEKKYSCNPRSLILVRGGSRWVNARNKDEVSV